MLKDPAPVLISTVREDLCLGYANTLSWRGRETPVETLQDLAGLLAWLEKSGGLGVGATRAVANRSRGQPKQAARVFAEAIALREVMFRIFSAFAAGEPRGERDFVSLRTAVAEAPPRTQLARVEDGHAWRIGALRPKAADLLAPVLWSAADLLLDAPHRRIRQCANHKCLWLFLDASKSGTRVWCDMASCGNRAKAQRHYSRIKQR